jgi:hypothetical protein
MSTNTTPSQSDSTNVDLTGTQLTFGNMRQNSTTGETFAYDRCTDEWFRVNDAVYALEIIPLNPDK